MSKYRYSPLSPGRDSIRLLRLLPHEDETADIQCELFEYSLPNSCERTHLYDALSYVWGNPDEKLPIFIHTNSFDVTVNLRAALSRLRNHSIERILWIDAICIDQANEKEKEHQIQSMAKIYGYANRVVVWLGETSDDSDLALEEIRIARDKKSTYYLCSNMSTDSLDSIKSTDSLDSERVQQAVLALLQRPWFRRIWILQEVAAARNVLIMCGSKKIDGYVFCLGVDSLKHYYEARPDLQGLIRSVTYLIREAIFRPSYSTGSSGRSSLDICPLGELMDMYHAHESTKRHDKVYALLGMSSDDLSKANLLPNYRDPWKELLQRLAKFIVDEEISVETWDDKEIAAFKSKGCILGRVSSVLRDTALDGRQSVRVIPMNNISAQPKYSGEQRWILRPSAKSIRDGDLICLLQGASKPMIIRLCMDHFAIIMIAATPLEIIRTEGDIAWPSLLRSAKTFNRDFLLLWDWNNSLKEFQDLEEYETLIRTTYWAAEHSKADRERLLDKATRTWNVALILGDVKEYKEAKERFREAIVGSKIAFGIEHPFTLKSQYNLTPLSWAAGNGYEDAVHPLLAEDGIDLDLKFTQYGQTSLWWAAEGWEAVVDLLLTGQVDLDVKDSYDWTVLSWAAKRGHEAVIKLLFDTGKVDVNAKDNYGLTALSWAAKREQEAVIKLLLHTGKVDVDAKDNYGLTALLWAAKRGLETAIKLLFDTGKVDVEAKDNYGFTAFSWAAKGGHEAVIKLLLDTGKVDVNAKDSHSRTALSWAAEGGHEAVVKLLLDTGKVEIDAKDNYGWTALSWAAKRGHEAVIKLLFDTGKVDVEAKDICGLTALSLGAEEGHEAVVKLLLDTGKVDIDATDRWGWTALLWATNRGHEAVVKLLQSTPNLYTHHLTARNSYTIWY